VCPKGMVCGEGAWEGEVGWCGCGVGEGEMFKVSVFFFFFFSVWQWENVQGTCARRQTRLCGTSGEWCQWFSCGVSWWWEKHVFLSGRRFPPSRREAVQCPHQSSYASLERDRSKQPECVGVKACGVGGGWYSSGICWRFMDSWLVLLHLD